MNKSRSLTLITCTVILFVNIQAHAETRLANIFGDNMVLQCDKPIAVWGWDKPGEEVTIQFADQSIETTASAMGRWSATLKAESASFDEREFTVNGSTEVAFSGVLVGEVWHCGGQSNMEWTLRGSRDADVEIDSADFPEIRYIRLPKIARPTRQDDFPVQDKDHSEGNWKLCTSPAVENCTAVGYYFAKRLRRRLNVPVGLIDTAWGGTVAQHWCSEDTLRDIPDARPYVKQCDSAMRAWKDGGGESGAQKRYQVDLKKWEADRVAAKAAGDREPRRPNADAYKNPVFKRQPAGMFNGMLAPIAHYTVPGVLFYQGENNSFSVS